MYAVVLFTQTNEVEVIPTSWLSVDHKVAFWPPYKDTEKAKSAVINKSEADETWGEYLVSVFKIYGGKNKVALLDFPPSLSTRS